MKSLEDLWDENAEKPFHITTTKIIDTTVQYTPGTLHRTTRW